MRYLATLSLTFFLFGCEAPDPIVYPEGATQETQVPGDDMTIGNYKTDPYRQAKEFCEENREDVLCKP
jgi:hypothetical protein